MQNSSNELLRVSSKIKPKPNLEIVRSLLLSASLIVLLFNIIDDTVAISPYKECLTEQKQTNLDILNIIENCEVKL